MGSKQQVPDGMLIGPKNPIIEEALGDRRCIYPVAAALRDEAAARGAGEHVVVATGDSGAGRRDAALVGEASGLPAQG